MRLDTSLARLHEQIASEGIPIDGVSGGQDAIRIDFRAEATPGQKARAREIVDGFDWRMRRPRSLSSLTAAINGLNANDQNKLLRATIARILQQNPNLARTVGVNLDGDEPE